MLRTAAMPGVSGLLSLTIHPRLLAGLRALGHRMRERGMGSGVYVEAIARALSPLENADARGAFLHTLRSVIDIHGQRVSATDRLYLAGMLPSMVVWGERDPLIPSYHAQIAHEAMPGSRLVMFEDAGHFPFLNEPVRFAHTLIDFIEDTEPAEFEFTDEDLELFRRRMLAGAD